jgi:hypothetical protein
MSYSAEDLKKEFENYKKKYNDQTKEIKRLEKSPDLNTDSV